MELEAEELGTEELGTGNTMGRAMGYLGCMRGMLGIGNTMGRAGDVTMAAGMRATRKFESFFVKCFSCRSLTAIPGRYLYTTPRERHERQFHHLMKSTKCRNFSISLTRK